jgi:hypothetical protein
MANLAGTFPLVGPVKLSGNFLHRPLAASRSFSRSRACPAAMCRSLSAIRSASVGAGGAPRIALAIIYEYAMPILTCGDGQTSKVLPWP